MDFHRRLRGLQQAMAESGVNLVAYGPGPDFAYLTGLASTWRSLPAEQRSADTVFVPREGTPTVFLTGRDAEASEDTWIADVRISEDPREDCAIVDEILGDLGVGSATVPAGAFVAAPVADALREAAGAEARSASGLTGRLRLIKEPQEIDRLRQIARLTDAAMEAVLPSIAKGASQLDIEAELARQGRLLGASGVSFPPAARFTKAGSMPSEDPFTYPPDKPLEAGTSIAFDFGFVQDGYCSDFGRSFYCGPVPPEVRGAYRALHEGLRETVGGMRAGTRIGDLFGMLETAVDRCGYGEYLRARLPNGVLGHSIGLDVHEAPWISPAAEGVLEANMVFALEPKLWDAGEYYLRVEDMVLVGEERSEFLTGFDRELFEL